jgi:hypothetical protein
LLAAIPGIIGPLSLGTRLGPLESRKPTGETGLLAGWHAGRRRIDYRGETESWRSTPVEWESWKAILLDAGLLPLGPEQISREQLFRRARWARPDWLPPSGWLDDESHGHAISIVACGQAQSSDPYFSAAAIAALEDRPTFIVEPMDDTRPDLRLSSMLNLSSSRSSRRLGEAPVPPLASLRVVVIGPTAIMRDR